MLKNFHLVILPLLITSTCHAAQNSKEFQDMVTNLLLSHATDIGPEWRFNATQARKYATLVVTLFHQFEHGKTFLEESIDQEGIRILTLALVLQQANCAEYFYLKDNDGVKTAYLARKDDQEEALSDKVHAALFGTVEKERIAINQIWLQTFLTAPKDQLEEPLAEITRISFN